MLLSDEQIKFLVQEIRGPGNKLAKELVVDADNIYYEAVEELLETKKDVIEKIVESAYCIEIGKEDYEDPSYDAWRWNMASDILFHFNRFAHQ